MGLAALAATPVFAADTAEQQQLKQLQQQIDLMRQDYEVRLKALEARVRQAEASSSAMAVAPPSVAASTQPVAAPASTPAPQPLPAPVAAAPTSANAFNPAISLILSASYASLSQDPQHYRFNGFLTGAEIGPGVQGFSLGESELTISASVDPWFFGSLSVALEADNGASVEEAFLQTTALPAGLGLKAGRFLSSIGYLNDQHAHTWDFVDQPLVYQAFLEGQLRQDGLQLRALLPTEQFIELGGSIGAGGPFPSGGSNGNRPGTATLFAHTGGDVGISHSWRAGLSYLWAKSNDRESWDLDASGNSVTQLFSGNTRMVIVDGVWKWAPNGNARRTSLTLQGEYMRRDESGSLTYDSTGVALTDSFSALQSGWYAQAVYKFLPDWRAGVRYDRLNVGNVDAASNNGSLFVPAYSPARATLMLDWAPSEYSRVRLQYANDRARYGLTDNQFIVQYQLSLGAHGAHGF
ncbi:MAG: hypothetical protein ACRC2B_18495 [Rubrivivax sp.]